MTKNSALNLAIKILRRWAFDYYGRDAKHKPEQKHEYDRIFQAISILESLKDGREK